MNGALRRARVAGRRRAAWLAFGSCIAVAALASPAQAQEAGPTGVAARPRPEYDPIGERLGALLIQPQVSATVSHDDNVFATSSNRRSDTVAQVTPKLAISTDWPNHALSLTLQGQFSRWDKLKSENTDEWSANAAGRLDIAHDMNLKFTAGHAENVEPRTDAVYAVTPLKPVTYQQDNGSLTFGKTFNRMRVTGTVSATKYNYDDTVDVIGNILDQSFRNRTESQASVRISYGASPKSSFFVEGGALRHEYDTTTIAGGSRNSTGRSVLFGVEGELTRLVHGEVSAGFVHYDFANPAYSDVDNFNYNVQLTWYPTDLLTIGLTGTQALNDTPLVTTPGYIYQSLAVTADYELRRNLIVSGRLEAAKEDYQGIARTDRRYGGSLSAKYLLARGVGVSFRYDHEQRDSSSVSAAGFRDNTVGVGVTLAR